MTEVILYRQQLLENPRFANQNPYNWLTTGTWSVVSGHITKTTGDTGTLLQESLLTHGARYELRFRMYGRTAGTLTVTNRSGGTTHLTTTANQIHVVEFTADGTDLIFNVTNTFDGSIAQASLYLLPKTYRLDLREDTPMPFTFDIDDIFNVSKRKAPGSKTIEFPGTHNNNLAFSQVYKLNSDSLFNPNLKSRVVIKNEGITVFDGDLCLDNIKWLYQNWNQWVDSYKTQGIGRLISIIELLGNYTVKDLDFSEYDHVYDLNKIYGSWNDDIVINGSPSQPNRIYSYTSPAISSYTTVTVDGFKHPKITFVGIHNLNEGDEIFVPAGTEFSFDQTIMSVPSTTEIILRCTQIDDFTGTLSGIVTQEMLEGKGYWYPACDYGTVHDPLFVTPGQNYPFESGRTYIIYDYQAPDDFTPVGGSNVTGTVFVANATAFVLITNSTVVDLGLFDGLTPKTVDPDTSFGAYSDTNKFWFYDDFIPHIFIREVFQKMMEFINISYDLPFEDEKFWRRIIISCNQEKFIHDEDLVYSYTEGDPIIMNDVLPEIKLSEIFISVVQAYNLGVIQDNDNPERVKFVKRNTFFDNTPINWTEKLHASRPLEMDMLNKNLPKTYHFKYSDSDDHYNETYKEEFGNKVPTEGNPNPIDRTYGDKYLIVRSDFLKSQNVVELAFVPTLIGYNALTDIVNSKCYYLLDEQLTGNVDPNEGIAERRYSPRWMFAGLRTTNDSPYFNLVTRTPAYQGAQQLGLNYYPYAGHIANIDDLYPDWDLNWDKPLGVYLDRTTSPELERVAGTYLNIDDEDWARNCLYNKNWRRFIESVTNKNSRLVTGYFKLSILDIYNLDFSIPIRVHDYVMKLNKVIDWNVTGDGICKCEFLLKTV